MNEHPRQRTVPLPGGTRLRIDEVGDPAGPLILQLEGHMAQLVATPSSYCKRLAQRGFRVVRVDNRDVGGSSRFAGSDYTLVDMARDVHELLAVLGSAAVVCGRSMGGAIAQLLAVEYPQDVLGLGLFFTYAKEDAAVARPLPIGPAPFDDEESFLAWERATLPGIAGSEHPFSQEYIEWLARTSWDRGVDWAGFERQRRAMALTDPWADRLAEVDVPTVIVHGEQDTVIPLHRAERLRELLPCATLHVVPGMGHQQPPALDELFAAATLELLLSR